VKDSTGLRKLVYKAQTLAQINKYKPEHITFLYGKGLAKIIEALMERILVDEMPTDLWAVLYYMYLIREGDERSEIWEAFETGARECVLFAQKLTEYRDFIYKDIRVERVAEGCEKHLILKYYDFGKSLSTISWNSLLFDIFAISLPNERLYYFFTKLKMLWGRTPISCDQYISLYNKLRKMVVEEGATESGIGNQLKELMRKERSQPEQNQHILLMLEGLYAVADTLNALWDNSTVSLYCPKCSRLNAPIISNNRLICRHCNSKVPENNLGIYVMINQIDASVLYSAISYELTKKSLLEKVFKTRENSISFQTIEERETYCSKQRAGQAEIILIKKKFPDICERAVELIQQSEPSRNTCFVIRTMQDTEIQDLIQTVKSPFVTILEDEKNELPGYYSNSVGYVKYPRGQMPNQIIKDLAIYNALIPQNE